MGSVLAKRNRIKVKNNLEEIIPKASSGIVFRKEANFDIICFDIKIVGFYPTRVRLWPQNLPTCFPTLELFLAVSSIDAGFDCQ